MIKPHPQGNPLTLFPLVLVGVGLLCVGCGTGASSGSAGSGGGDSGGSSFSISSLNVLEGMEWKINRPIDITFTKDVDFSSISQNTVSIRDQFGNGALGVFSVPRGQMQRAVSH